MIICLSTKAQLTASFTANLTEGCGSLGGVQFTSTSTGNPTTWDWDFGNGNFSQNQNPQASFSNTQFYTITLIVGNGTTSDTITRTNYIKVYKNPVANFSYTPISGCAPIDVNFLSTSTLGDNPITNYVWDFRDGSSSPNSANPTHQYKISNTYFPNLQIIDAKGCTDNISLGPISIIPAVIADFTTLGPTSSCTNSLIVDFVSNSTGTNLSYAWAFGDGTTSTAQNPTHTYNGFGSYTVTLTVSNPNCNDVLVKTNYILLANPIANFMLPKKEFCKGEPISITNTSGPSFNVVWDFGDGTNSTVKNPNKVYSDSGMFIINLTISLGNCTDSKKDTIRIEKAVARFRTNTIYNCNKGDTVKFIDSSFNAAIYSWRINTIMTAGDGIYTVDSTLNPILIYDNYVGTFSDSLIVTSLLGCHDTTISVNNRFYDRAFISITDQAGLSPIKFQGCFPQTLDFNSILTAPANSGTYSYSWILPDGSSSLSADPTQMFTFNDDSSRSVSVNVISSKGCKANDGKGIELGFAIPPIIVFSDTTVCLNDTIWISNRSLPDSTLDFTVYHYFSANFLGDSLLFGSADSAYIATFNDTGYFNIIITNSYNGCRSRTIIDSAFFVNGPIVNSSFKSNCLNRGLINFKADMKGGTRFEWDFGDTTFNSLDTNPTHQYNHIRPYPYYLTVYNDTNGCPPIIDSGLIALTPPPSPTIFPSNETFCNGDSATIFILNTLGYDSVFWKVNGIPIDSGASFILHFNQRGKNTVDFEAVDFIGCRYFSTKDYFVSKPQANFGFTQNNNCLPLEVIFRDSSILDTSLMSAYFVIQNRDTISPGNPYFFTTGGIKSVNYFITDSLGCSDSIKIPNLFDLKPFSVNLRTSSTTLICQGTSVNFRNTSTDLSANFNWNFGDGDSLQSNQAFLNHAFDSVGTFEVILTGINSSNCIKTDEITFIVEAIPQVGFTADTLISNCYPLEVQFSDTSKGVVINWYWRIGPDQSILKNPRYNFNEVGKYDVFLRVTTANGCSDSILKTQYIQTNGPTADFTIDKKEGCVNDLFTFTMINPVNVNTFVWDFGDGEVDSTGTTVTHSYKKVGKIYPNLILKDINGVCDVPIVDSITIYDVKADFTISADTGCTPLAVIFENTSIGANSFKWNFGNGFNSGSNLENQLYITEGRYSGRLAISSNLGCIDTTEKFVQVFKTPDLTVFPDTGICIGDSIHLLSSGGGSYLWSPSQFLTFDSISNPIAFPNNSTNYVLNVTSDDGCFKDTSVFVEVVVEPRLPNLTDTSLIIGETLYIDVTVGNKLIYNWTPITGISCSDCATPTFQPLETTTYYLSIKDRFGCFEIYDTLTIIIDEKYSLDVPKAFTPNNDGNNDIIYAKGWGLKELLSFKIYNRFGELVFESKDFSKGWDGKYKGKIQNIETYVYTVEALTFSDKILSKKGNISLLR